MPKREKRVKFGASPNAAKVVPASPAFVGKPAWDGSHIYWRFSTADNGGKWPWNKIDDKNLREFHRRVTSFETADFATLRKLRSEHAVSTICKDAQARLVIIGMDDVERVCSYHLGKKERAWFAAHGSVMCLLWWDPSHTVYPTPKKRT